ncbi:nucleoside deaminase [Homoserinimonas sp. OAct 916]|uniref:nucleoside deaminase n=1 Tax=Homoserinimonas sp. OAct 916 TaxID=2211450 RepID=UPI001E2AE3A9|nr:nucleoside deaminase [Homoserinimonas sp. OAct 916]
MESPQKQEKYLSRAIDLAIRNVDNGGGPFGALIVTADGREFEGLNRVTATNDPTAHAEVTAIRAACAGIENFDLTGATLYTSCEPCPMCLASALWARVDSVVFAADRHDAAAVGFDDAEFYEFFDQPVAERSMPVVQYTPVGTDAPTPTAPFEQWTNLESRIEY